MTKISEINEEFPSLLKDTPSKAFVILTDWMNLVDHPNNWLAFATEVWPNNNKAQLEIKLKGGKMEKILEIWASEKGKTSDLVQILVKLKRNDVLAELKKEFPSFR
jgi:hypothetical protein